MCSLFDYIIIQLDNTPLSNYAINPSTSFAIRVSIPVRSKFLGSYIKNIYIGSVVQLHNIPIISLYIRLITLLYNRPLYPAEQQCFHLVISCIRYAITQYSCETW